MRDVDSYEVAMCAVKMPELPDNHPTSENIENKPEVEVSLCT